ncbi:MAG: DJ-1/PfpI family protein [Candidatus Altiarchaeota archaeon]|nr:DJ-1/PfpI family protein [Candidatus Altiarchaeota archaeon]
MNVLFVIAQKDFRDEEYQIPRQIIEETGAKISVASPQGGTCTGTLGATVEADYMIDEVNEDDYNAIVVVGGSGSKKQLWNNNRLREIVSVINSKKGVVAGICLSSVVLAKAGALDGRNATVFETPETLEELRNFGAEYLKKSVVADGNIVTASGPEAATEFGMKVVEKLAAA